MFTVHYGVEHPLTGWSGMAIGVQGPGRAGWLEITGPAAVTVDTRHFWAFQEQDRMMASAEFLRNFSMASAPSHYARYRLLLAETTVFGPEGLAPLAHTLHVDANEQIASVLIRNSLVRSNQELLFIMAGVSSPTIATEARHLLRELWPN